MTVFTNNVFGLGTGTVTSPRVGAYDFTVVNPNLPPEFTFTRTSQATFTDSLGRIQISPANQPRFDWNPLTGRCKGLLIEGARTNLVQHSATLTPVWGTANANRTAGSTLSPDGVNVGATITSTNAGWARTQFQMTHVISAVVSLSVFMRAIGGANGALFFHDGGGSSVAGSLFVLSGSGTVLNPRAGTTATISNVGNGWYRCTITFTAGVANGFIAVGPDNEGAATGTPSVTGAGIAVEAWGAQGEVGAFASSYIPTTGAAASRAVENANINTLSNIRFNSLEGTFLVEYESPYTFVSGFLERSIFSFGTDLNNWVRIVLDIVGTVRMASTTGGVIDVNIDDGGAVRNIGTFKTAFVYRQNDFAICTNGASVISDTVALVPPITQLRIGQNIIGGSVLNGYIRRFAYTPTRLPNSFLQTMTT